MSRGEHSDNQDPWGFGSGGSPLDDETGCKHVWTHDRNELTTDKKGRPYWHKISYCNHCGTQFTEGSFAQPVDGDDEIPTLF